MPGLHGHLWTVAPHLLAQARARLGALRVDGERPFATTVHDPEVGPVRLSGSVRAGDTDTAVVLVHGLGGHHDSAYVSYAARAVAARGWGYLRLSLRGADGSGEDLYHAGLAADVAAAVASPELAAYRRLFVLGFSLGGHLTLRYALDPGDARVRAVAALCAPLDLSAACDGIDRPTAWPYRRHVLMGLRAMYGELERRGRAPVPRSALAGVKTVRAWDDAVVAPRHGFASAADYYARVSVAPHLARLAVPALYVGADEDPMVLPAKVRPALEAAAGAPNLEVRWTRRGGHVWFPADADLGLPGRGIFDQVLGWLADA